MSIAQIPVSGYVVLLIAAAVSDVLTMRISNRLPLAIAVLFLLAAPFAGLDAGTVLLHVLAAAVLLLVGFGLFASRVLGGGDAKLMAAVALWVGLPGLPPFLFGMSLAGALLALVLLAFRRVMLPASAARYGWIARLHDGNAGIPYGVAIAAGALLAFPYPLFASG